MKQLGLAYVQYTQDSDEVCPAGVTASGTGWAGEIYSFCKSVEVYQCPHDPQTGSYVSYAENRNLVRQSLASFNDPAATVELYEFTTLNCDPSSVFPPGATPPTVTRPTEFTSATGLSAPQNSTRHDLTATTFSLNFLAADGHVKWLTPKQVSSGPNALPTAKIKKAGPAWMTFSVN